MLIKPVNAKLHRQPILNRIRPSSGTPIAEENLADESKIAVARLRARGGNHNPTALAFAGNVGASPTPNKKRAPNKLGIPGAAAALNDAMLQTNVLTRPIRFTPNRSSSTPIGNWHKAYVQLYAPDKYPNVTFEIPNAAISASCDTERFTRSK